MLYERYLSRMYVCACVMCAVFDNRSSSAAPEHKTHSAKNVPNNLFNVHGTSCKYMSITSHIRQPRANHVPHTTSLEPPLGATSSTAGLRIEREAGLILKASSALDVGQGTASRSSSIISGWKARVLHTQKDSLI